MNTLFHFLRAAHGRHTHQYFALDALKRVRTEPGMRMVRLLLRFHERYLAGAIDPDIRFRDFQNHVIHTTDGYWGGAPRVAHQWYDRLLRYLRTERYGDAAHAAGVLGHYVTDVMQPLHTQTCPRERVLHDPIERTALLVYDELLRGWQDHAMRIVFQLSRRREWLGEAMLHGARVAHQRRESLLNGYRLDIAAEDPCRALDGNARGALSESFGLAITGLARVLERAAAEGEAERGEPIPAFSLAVPTVFAGLRVPTRLAVRWWTLRRQRSLIVGQIDEFRRTGAVVDCLSPEIDVTHRVVKVFHDERRWKQSRAQRLRSTQTRIAIENDRAA